MKSIQHRHRRWLDAQMPSAVETTAQLDATMAVIARRRPWLWPGIGIAAAGAALAATLLVTRSPSPLPPAEWSVSLALHVPGQPQNTDVHIRIATRNENPR